RRAAVASRGRRVRRGRLAGRGARHERQGVRRSEARAGEGRGVRRRAAGTREAQYRAVQVSARDRVRRRTAAHGDGKAAALQAEARGHRPGSQAMIQILQPPEWARPKGFAHGIAVRGGTTVYIAGQIGWTADERFEEKTFGGQFRQAIANIVAVLAQAGGRPEHLVRLTLYVLDKQEYLASLREVGAAY